MQFGAFVKDIPRSICLRMVLSNSSNLVIPKKQFRLLGVMKMHCTAFPASLYGLLQRTVNVFGLVGNRRSSSLEGIQDYLETLRALHVGTPAFFYLESPACSIFAFFLPPRLL